MNSVYGYKLFFLSRIKKLTRVIERTVGYLFSAHYTGKLTNPAVGIERLNVSEGAVIVHALADKQMIVGESGYLSLMRNAQYLTIPRKLTELLADPVGG